MNEFEAQVNELRNNPTEIREMLSQVEHLQEELEAANKEIKNFKTAYDLAKYSIYTQHCTMNHMENTDHEKGQIIGLIQAGKILRSCFGEKRDRNEL